MFPSIAALKTVSTSIGFARLSPYQTTCLKSEITQINTILNYPIAPSNGPSLALSNIVTF